MVPVNEFNRLSNYYQGKITESALLNKAGRLAAEQQLILDDKSIPDSLAVRMVKPMALEQGRLVKRVRTGTAQPTAYEGIEEPEGMVDAPIERLLKDIIKKQAPDVIELEDDTTVTKKVKKKLPKKLAIKKRTLPSSPKASPSAKKPPPTPKASSGATKTPTSGSQRLTPRGLSESAKKTLRNLGFKEGEDSPKGGAKGKKKIRKNEVEKLQEGEWEAWKEPSKRKLKYAETGEEEDND